MAKKEHQVACYILHRRPYRETSAIIDVVAEGFGRLSLILRGVYNNKKKSGIGAQAQVFRPLLISFAGSGELKYINAVENNGPVIGLTDKHLYSGFYINELICRLWPQNINSDELFEIYRQSLDDLVQCQQRTADKQLTSKINYLEIALRQFEFNLLGALGYGIDCFFTCDSDEAIEAGENYLFLPQQGFTWFDPFDPYAPLGTPFNGTMILAIGEMNFTAPRVLKAAKQLTRLALAHHLGHKPLKSRELFMTIQSDASKK